MAFWNEPIEIGRIWRGPRRLTPFASYACTVCGRCVVIVGIASLVVFFVAMVALTIMILVHDPVVGLGSWAIVGAMAGALALRGRTRRAPPSDPDEPIDGSGVPIPRTPSPLLRIGGNAKEIPHDHRRVG